MRILIEFKHFVSKNLTPLRLQYKVLACVSDFVQPPKKQYSTPFSSQALVSLSVPSSFIGHFNPSVSVLSRINPPPPQ
jgi:hypothetical protein